MAAGRPDPFLRTGSQTRMGQVSDAKELEQSLLVGHPDVAARLLAALEDQNRRHALDGELGGDAGRVVDVELADPDLALVLVGETLDDRVERLAGPTPDRAEVEEK